MVIVENKEQLIYSILMQKNCKNILLSEEITELDFLFNICQKEYGKPLEKQFFEGIAELNYNNITSLDGMFANCVNFNQEFKINAPKLKSIQYVFCNCENLNAEIEFKNSNPTTTAGCFYNCNKLNSNIYIDYSQIINCDGMFFECINLEKRKIKNLDTLEEQFHQYLRVWNND